VLHDDALYKSTYFTYTLPRLSKGTTFNDLE